MESNREEAQRSLEVARTKLARGDVDGALKFVQKSLRLFPTSAAEKLQQEIANQQSDRSNQQAMRAKISDILKIDARDYYAILKVEKSSTQAEIKKSYRKLALEFHPDKNSTPGADEVFKRIGNAFAVLGDEEKRQNYHYDPRQPTASYSAPRYQEAEISPEELFNIIFGGNGVHFTHTRTPRARQKPADDEFYCQRFLLQILSLLPVIALLVISMFGIFVPPDPTFSFAFTNRYNTQRISSRYKIEYYVNQHEFNSLLNYDNTGRQLQSWEWKVEKSYRNILERECQREKQQKAQMEWQSRGFFSNDDALWERAQNMPMPFCDKLQELMWTNV